MDEIWDLTESVSEGFMFLILRGITDFRLTVECVKFYDTLAAPYLPFRDDTKISRGQSPTRADTTIFVQVALVNTMRLYGTCFGRRIK